MLFCFALCNFEVYSQKISIRFDGLYQTVTEDNYRQYLRFYPDSTVIRATSTSEAKDVFTWLTKPFDGQGKYEIREEKIYFTTTSGVGTIVFNGVINDEFKLTINQKSLINGYEETEIYYFVKP
jgi:hypothetical protein